VRIPAAVAAVALALLSPSLSAAAPFPGERPMWIEKVKDGLYLLRGPIVFGCMLGCPPGQTGDGVLHEPGPTVARVTPEGVVLVDAKFPQHAPEIARLVASVTDRPIRYLINSHHHPDHTSGDAELMKRGAELIQQRHLRERYEAVKQGGGSAKFSFDDYFALNLGGATVEAYNLVPAGHTRGDTFVYFPDLKVVHMGDLIIRGMPHIDYAGGGGSAVGFVSAIYDLLKLDFDVGVPGHGQPMTRQEIWEYVQKVETMNARMKDAVRRGVPVERVVPELGLESLGWARSASTANFLANDVRGYYAEMAAVVAAEQGRGAATSAEGPRR
jgi:glyoxylase-like metal-dependent hydrolase (beta-lactamase superfamily II)